MTNRQRSYSEKLWVEKNTNANRKLFRCFQVLEANLFRSSGALDTWTTTFSRKMCPDEETNFKLFDGLGKIFLLPMYFHLLSSFFFSFCPLFTPLRLYGFDIEKRSTKERWNCSYSKRFDDSFQGICRNLGKYCTELIQMLGLWKKASIKCVACMNLTVFQLLLCSYVRLAKTLVKQNITRVSYKIGLIRLAKVQICKVGKR